MDFLFIVSKVCMWYQDLYIIGLMIKLRISPKGTRQMSAQLALEVPYESGTIRDSSPSRNSQKGC